MKGLPRVARVFWLDALHYSEFESIEWLVKEARPSELYSVGHILKMDKDVVLVAQELNISKGKARDTTVINRKDVLRIEWLVTEPEKGEK